MQQHARQAAHAAVEGRSIRSTARSAARQLAAQPARPVTRPAARWVGSSRAASAVRWPVAGLRPRCSPPRQPWPRSLVRPATTLDSGGPCHHHPPAPGCGGRVKRGAPKCGLASLRGGGCRGAIGRRPSSKFGARRPRRMSSSRPARRPAGRVRLASRSARRSPRFGQRHNNSARPSNSSVRAKSHARPTCRLEHRERRHPCRGAPGPAALMRARGTKRRSGARAIAPCARGAEPLVPPAPRAGRRDPIHAYSSYGR